MVSEMAQTNEKLNNISLHDKVATSIDNIADKIEDSKATKSLNNFEEKLKVGAGPLDWLRHFNDWLENVPTTIVDYFNTIFKSGGKIPQKGVDMICEYGAWFVNYNVEKMRQKVIKSLYEQYGFMFAIQKKIMWVKEMFTNPLSILGAVVNVVKGILNFFLGPIAYVIMYMVNAVKEVIRLAENLTKLASVLPPDPPDPSVDFHAFKLQVGKMGASILTDDPSQLPKPKEMFPEPIRPFTPEYWKALGTSASKTYREQKAFYELPEEDFATKISQNYGSTKTSLSNLKTTKLSGDENNFA